MTATRGLALGALIAMAACDHGAPPSRPPATRSADMVLASIPPTPVAGMLGGRAFHTVEAWYRVVRMPGRERLDLIMSEGHPTRLCSESEPELAREVWVRFPGVTRLSAGEQRVDPPADMPFSVHYEWTEDQRWTGHGGGSALIAIDDASRTMMAGRLKICFDDATSSCVTGSFHAFECRNELDLDGPRSGTNTGATDGGTSP